MPWCQCWARFAVQAEMWCLAPFKSSFLLLIYALFHLHLLFGEGCKDGSVSSWKTQRDLLMGPLSVPRPSRANLSPENGRRGAPAPVQVPTKMLNKEAEAGQQEAVGKGSSPCLHCRVRLWTSSPTSGSHTLVCPVCQESPTKPGGQCPRRKWWPALQHARCRSESAPLPAVEPRSFAHNNKHFSWYCP